MPDCEEVVYSNDYYDFIISYDALDIAQMPGETFCVQRIDESYDVFYYDREQFPEQDLITYTYTAIPKCFGLLDETALEVSGITKMQNLPGLSLKGNGVLIGFIDTGIDYENNLFRFSDGSSRIYRIWDQTIRGGQKPSGFIYGAEYTREQINEALRQENEEVRRAMVPSMDENGHGTFLAGVTCGGEDVAHEFIGAAPYADIAVVKLKQAKQYLRDFFFIPEDAAAYQENDIMAAVAYLNKIANESGKPLVLCLGLGSSMGSHGGDSPLSRYLNYIFNRRKRAVVAAAGNEANARRHFRGQIMGDMTHEDVEINVEEDVSGFFVELWSGVPEIYSVTVLSPTGERLPQISPRYGSKQEFTFVFENTTVTVDYRIVGGEAAEQLIFLRFTNVKRGIWTISVYPQVLVTGIYNMWLPMRQLSDGNIFFLRSVPDETVTAPGTAAAPITVGGYNATTGGIYPDSGRGYSTSGMIKPELAAPAVNVYGPGLNGSFVTYTGTSAAAAITAGACAQVMEWASVQGNEPFVTTAWIKNMLIRGARQSDGREYPNREWGYGALDVYGAFEVLRQ